MMQTTGNIEIASFKSYLSTCVNTICKVYRAKEVILNLSPAKKLIGFIEYGNAKVIKTDMDGNTVIIKELKKYDIFSNLFFDSFEDDIYIMSSEETRVIFIDYYDTIKNCNRGCNYHNSMIFTLFELLIRDYKQQNEKIELLSKRCVRDKIMFFLRQRMNEDNVFYVTTSYTAIAEYIAVDRSNFMRELKKLEKEGQIKKENKEIKILD